MTVSWAAKIGEGFIVNIVPITVVFLVKCRSC